MAISFAQVKSRYTLLSTLSINIHLFQEWCQFAGLNKQAYLYIGMPGSFAGMHTEESNVASINVSVGVADYKVWTTIAPEHYEKVKEAARELFPEEWEKCHNFLPQIHTDLPGAAQGEEDPLRSSRAGPT